MFNTSKVHLADDFQLNDSSMCLAIRPTNQNSELELSTENCGRKLGVLCQKYLQNGVSCGKKGKEMLKIKQERWKDAIPSLRHLHLVSNLNCITHFN